MDSGSVLVGRVDLDMAEPEIQFGLKQPGGKIREESNWCVVRNERTGIAFDTNQE